MFVRCSFYIEQITDFLYTLLIKRGKTMSQSTTASATSLNFIGFNDMIGNGTAPILFNRVVILPKPRATAGKWIHPVAGYIPGQQPFLKPPTQVWNKSLQSANKHLARQGFKQIYNGYY